MLNISLLLLITAYPIFYQKPEKLPYYKIDAAAKIHPQINLRNFSSIVIVNRNYLILSHKGGHTLINTTYNYNTGTNYNYNPAYIGFAGGFASLLLVNNNGVFSQNYASSSGFTYNPSYTEFFVSGLMQQKDQSPPSLLAYAAWDTFLNINYGLASLTVTPFNSAAISGGFLNLQGSTNKYVQLPNQYVVSNMNTIAFVYQPNYSGHPGSNQIMYGNSGSANYFALFHAQSTGNFTLTMSDQLGVLIANINFGAWSPTAGTNYTIVCQVDVSNGATKLFINGAQFGSTNTATGVRTLSTAAWVGLDGVPADSNSNFSIQSFALYSSIVGPSAVTPLGDYNFVPDVITLPPFSYSGAGSILSWLTPTISDTNAPQYTLNGLYWNGSAWVSSNLSFAQSNTAAVVIANIASLPLSNTMSIKVYWDYRAQTPMSTSTFNLGYTGQIYPTDPVISPNIPLSMDLLSTFTDVESASGSDGIGWYLKIGSSFYWYNGFGWVTSNQSYAQSNTAAQIQLNASTLPIRLGAFVTPFAILHSASGLTTPTLTSSTLTYEYFGPAPIGPNICAVYGYMLDESGLPIVGATVIVKNATTFINQGVVQVQGVKSAVTDSLGYFNFDLYETTTVNVKLEFSAVYPFTGVTTNTFVFGNALIPNVPEVNFATLTFSP